MGSWALCEEVVFTEFVQCQHEHLLRDCGTAAEEFFSKDTWIATKGTQQPKRKKVVLQVPSATNPFRRNAKYKGFSFDNPLSLRIRLIKAEVKRHFKLRCGEKEFGIEENPSAWAFEGKQRGLISNSVCLCSQLSSQFPGI
ncbi:hypothetical protein CEXT_620171 [Caerostris extrusa]|uniref:Uncharacterized protein n=1 Tax=Caerostris extrusa TaxID=172846 RepID=A0AAV4NS63_CAEEX|nr:hypothetical protein CEXT_620171 [Caerostris extrusa]